MSETERGKPDFLPDKSFEELRHALIDEVCDERLILRRALDNACGFIAHDLIAHNRPPITKSDWKEYFILVATEELKLAKGDK